MTISQHDINKNETVKNCKVCNGKGTVLVPSARALPTKNPKRQVRFTRAALCICRLNEQIELKYTYFNPERTTFVTEQMAAASSQLYDINKNILFDGDTSEIVQRCKAVFVHHRADGAKLFYIGNGIEIVLEYYVKQPDGVERSLADLIRNHDLVVIVFNTQASNRAVAGVMVELIQGRYNAGKATWIIPFGKMEDAAEYSEDLTPLLKNFCVKKVSYDTKGTKTVIGAIGRKRD